MEAHLGHHDRRFCSTLPFNKEKAALARRPRILILGTYHGDYSTELAIALSNKADVLLFVDGDQVANDCGPAQMARFRQIGAFYAFSRRKLARITSMARLMRVLCTKRPDLCITHAHYDPYLLYTHRLISLFCPLYLIVHDPIPHVGRDAALSAKARALDRRGRAMARVLLVHGDFCLGQLESTGEIEGRPVLNVSHGPILRPDRYSEPLDPPFALMFGRMEGYKGLDVLLAACRKLALLGRPARCKLMGRGPELERLKTDFEGVGVDVVCGFVRRETLIEAMQNAAFVLAPYTEATQSGVVAAAFASGRPVVASAVGGLVDAIAQGENGLLVSPADPDALAEAMDRMFADPALRTRLSQGARRTASTTIDWVHYADEIIRSFGALHQR